MRAGRAGVVLAAVLLGAMESAAQTPATAEPAKVPAPASPEPAKATEAAAPSAKVVFARVEVDQQPVRCFDSENSPIYLDQLARGDVVQVGEERNGFVPVTLPLGATGYVHKKFATPPDEQGFVRANGKKVSFRYRPRSTEAPADSLEDGVALHLMAEEGEWYVVRNPRALAFVPRASLAFDVDAAAATAACAKLEETRREQWQKATAARIEAGKRADLLTKQRAELQDVVARFRAEVAKPWPQQARATYGVLEASATKLVADFDAGSSEHLTATSLTQQIRTQVLVLDAQAVATENLPPPKLEVTVAKATVEDPLARFDLVGWVRVVKSPVPSRSVRLVRGGRVLGYMTCSSDRYDFSLFDGVEVGVVGPKEAAADGAWLLDVQRLDVLGVQAR